MLKRSFDVLAAAIGLVLLAPLLLFIAAWIKVSSPGPVLFRQERVGRYGRNFYLHKFRTMKVDAERGSQITVAGDPRITRAGAVLRKYKLDELPQLYDVLKGDMSLVGPRPEVPKYVALYPAAAREVVLSVRPGITDHAAIEFAEESELLAQSADPHATYVHELIPRKLQLYQSYVTTQSFLGDLQIIARTVLRIVARRH
jgi:lipopolysaccharide/colanic/teichoic acid biosynthesis glycosyltransferase